MRAAAFLRREEGLRLMPYKCEAGHWTVGYGHRCEAGQGPVTLADAEALLFRDLSDAKRPIDEIRGLSVGQRVALVSFVFNLGAAAFGKSTLRKKLVAGAFAEAAAEIERWVYVRTPEGLIVSKGLEARRARERIVFERG